MKDGGGGGCFIRHWSVYTEEAFGANARYILIKYVPASKYTIRGYYMAAVTGTVHKASHR